MAAVTIHSDFGAPPSLGFSRQEHWSGLPFPSPMQESEKELKKVKKESKKVGLKLNIQKKKIMALVPSLDGK